MWQWITGLSGIDAVFFGCATLGGAVFLLRIVLLVIGLDHDGDVDMDVHGDVDLHGDVHHDVGPGVLSISGLSAFFLMFGLTGLVMHLEQGLGPTLSTGLAFATGMFVAWGVAKALGALYRLKSSGNIDVHNAVGVDGRVYLTIPVKGRGQVEVAVQKRLRVYDAVAEHPVELKTGTHVRVVRVVEGNVLVVEKA